MSDSEDETIEKQLKIVLVGEAGTGKTSLVSRYCHNDFSRPYYPTAGVDFFLKRISLSGARNVTLELWDVGGQALSGNMLDKYVYGANVIILVYDVTNATSFDCLEDWFEAVQKITASEENRPTITIVGNKCDMEHQRSVRVEKHHKFAQENGLSAHIMSARTGEAVALSLQKIVAEALGLRLTRAELEDQHTVMTAELVNTPAESHCRSSMQSNQPKPSILCTIQ